MMAVLIFGEEIERGTMSQGRWECASVGLSDIFLAREQKR
jgi:hypothetical protein